MNLYYVREITHAFIDLRINASRSRLECQGLIALVSYEPICGGEFNIKSNGKFLEVMNTGES